ncbi:hypothetical protein [Ochrobactrum teleogrylli]
MTSIFGVPSGSNSLVSDRAYESSEAGTCPAFTTPSRQDILFGRQSFLGKVRLRSTQTPVNCRVNGVMGSRPHLKRNNPRVEKFEQSVPWQIKVKTLRFDGLISDCTYQLIGVNARW